MLRRVELGVCRNGADRLKGAGVRRRATKRNDSRVETTSPLRSTKLFNSRTSTVGQHEAAPYRYPRVCLVDKVEFFLPRGVGETSSTPRQLARRLSGGLLSHSRAVVAFFSLAASAFFLVVQHPQSLELDLFSNHMLLKIFDRRVVDSGSAGNLSISLARPRVETSRRSLPPFPPNCILPGPFFLLPSIFPSSGPTYTLPPKTTTRITCTRLLQSPPLQTSLASLAIGGPKPLCTFPFPSLFQKQAAPLQNSPSLPTNLQLSNWENLHPLVLSSHFSKTRRCRLRDRTTGLLLLPPLLRLQPTLSLGTLQDLLPQLLTRELRPRRLRNTLLLHLCLSSSSHSWQ